MSGHVVLGPDDPFDGAVVELPAELTEACAVAAVLAWRGARVFRAPAHADQVRLALDMTASLAGERPPALTRRGLA